MKKYKMIQISEESHAILKQWCELNDKKISKVVERMIEDKTKINKQDEKNILRVQTNR